ncbi:MAG TPA: hypothetical protein VF783_21790 [Terriglobales bacterium]
MNRKVSLVLCTAVAAAMLSVTAVAQGSAAADRVPSPRLSYAVYEPSQSAAKLQLVDWDNHRRCDGDHDRDDRHCYWRDRDGDRYYYRGNGYVAYSPMYYPGGWYDKHGRWHRDGWYDRDRRWHKGNPAR